MSRWRTDKCFVTELTVVVGCMGAVFYWKEVDSISVRVDEVMEVVMVRLQRTWMEE